MEVFVMASIRKHSQTGALFFDFRYYGSRCREYTTLPDTAINRKKMEKVLVRLEEQISLGSFAYRDFFPNSKNALKFDQVSTSVADAFANSVFPEEGQVKPTTPFFKDFANIWFDEKSVEWRTSHKKNVRHVLDHRLIPQFGEKVVGSITKADILAFRADLAKAQAWGKKQTLSNPRINKILMPLRQILCEAADRFDFRMPFQNIKQLKIKRTDVQPFTLEQVKAIIDTVRIDFKDYFTVRFFTGMRTGEIHGLKWKYESPLVS
jgi:integrase